MRMTHASSLILVSECLNLGIPETHLQRVLVEFQEHMHVKALNENTGESHSMLIG